ncbi:MAG: FAD:protein FMN transferase [Myxococcales bacterium]|nr:FAD:protein FMN transferase [Myxococcales bacterium]
MWPRGPETVRFDGPTMGTSFAVTVVAESISDAEAEALRALVADELAEINRLMSNYVADSEISRFNAHEGLDPFPLSPPMVEVLAISDEIHALSGGAYDITIPPLLEAWGFGPRGDKGRATPSDADLEALGDRVGQGLLKLDAKAGQVTKGHPKLEIDLSAIAPGYAADRIAAALEARGYHRYMVDVGGEFRVHGRNQRGEPWQIGIERPAASRDDAPVLQEVVPLTEGALATSGDYRSYRETAEGKRVSHTIDPRTRRPIDHRLASVTVVAADAGRADAIATALNVLGPDEGLALAVENDLPVMMIVRAGDGFETRTTPPFDALRQAAGSATIEASP